MNMKIRIVFGIIFLSAMLVSCGGPQTTDSPAVPVDEYINIGKTWTAADISADWGVRQSFGAVVFKNSLFVIGGFSSLSPYTIGDVWRTTDGTAWTKDTTNFNGISGLRDFDLVSYNNKLWIIGGVDRYGMVTSKAFSSSDGTNWSSAAVGFGPRFKCRCVVFNGNIWMIGGFDNLSAKMANDVWFSKDGTNWYAATTNAGFTPRYEFGAVVFDNKIWVFGGGTNISLYAPFCKDVWCSSDGTNWTQANASAPFGFRMGFGYTVGGGKIWLAGGLYNTNSATNDIWSSADGINWTSVTNSAYFPVRNFFEMVFFQEKLWILGGDTEAAGTTNDIWYSSK